MKQWEIWVYPFEKERSHPVVIISNDERAERAENVNGLLCVTLRGGQPLRAHEVLLNGEDGLEWETACRCDYFYALPKANFRGNRRGLVSKERRRAIAGKINEILRLANP